MHCKTCTKSPTIGGCLCTYQGCERKGKCCECVAYHRQKDQLPACYFSKDEEKTYDRNITHYNEYHK